MTFCELNRLIAKDAIINKYGPIIKSWPLTVWEEEVQKQLKIFLARPYCVQTRIRYAYLSGYPHQMVVV